MNHPPKDDLWPTREFFENRRNFPPEEVEKYRGLYIAWSPDGRKVLDSDDSSDRLWDKLVAAGVDPGRTVIDYIDEADILL